LGKITALTEEATISLIEYGRYVRSGFRHAHLDRRGLACCTNSAHGQGDVCTLRASVCEMAEVLCVHAAHGRDVACKSQFKRGKYACFPRAIGTMNEYNWRG
jgi:tagatose-1,6-bisphosphate aldolase non-catalytic subunit AgaZ/GatZ